MKIAAYEYQGKPAVGRVSGDGLSVQAFDLPAADAVLAHTHQILAANATDLDSARAGGTPEAMLDRLALNPQRIDGIAAGLRQVAGLPDPIGEVLRGRTMPNGLQVRQQKALAAIRDLTTS